MPDYSEFTKKLEINLPATAAAADYDQGAAEMPVAGKITAASYTPEANITGNTTESRTLTIVNKGADGNGTTVMATLAFITSVNATDFNESAFTLSVVADAVNFAQGDILAAVSTHVGASGLADPGGLVQIEYKQVLG
jgi:hypothetical protein